MRWHMSWRADPRARPLADRHYNRQSPGSPQFAPPGRCAVFLTQEADALWITSWPFARYTKHEWAGAWVNSLFRNESSHLSSTLIREAVAATYWHYLHTESWRVDPLPKLGMVTFVDSSEVRSTNPGCCYKHAGFEHVGFTKAAGLYALQLKPECFPEPQRAKERVTV